MTLCRKRVRKDGAANFISLSFEVTLAIQYKAFLEWVIIWLNVSSSKHLNHMCKWLKKNHDHQKCAGVVGKRSETLNHSKDDTIYRGGLHWWWAGHGKKQEDVATPDSCSEEDDDKAELQTTHTKLSVCTLHHKPLKLFGCVNDFYKKNPSNSHAWGRKGLPTKETQQKKDIESIVRYNKYATLTPSLATHLLFAPAILIAQEAKHPFLWLKDLLVINFCLGKNHNWPLELPMLIYMLDINPKLCAKSAVFKIE